MIGSFDKKGFFFFLKFSFIFVLFFSCIRYLPDVLFNSTFLKDSLVKDGLRAKWASDMTATVIESRKDSKIKTNNPLNVAFVGDIMLDRGVLYKINKVGDGDYSFIFEKIKNELKSYDLVVGNLEGPISDKGFDGGNLYSFRMDPVIIDLLKGLGFKALSVANNHIYDWRKEAMEDTFKRLSENGILYPGGGMNEEEAYSPKYIEIKNTKISILSFSEFGKGEYEAIKNNSGIAVISEGKMKESITKAKVNSDLVFVSFHFGEEYKKNHNSYQEKYAKLAIDFGADLVVGHHPHVIQELENYKNTYIAYSLGNFVFDQYFSEDTMMGGLLEVRINNKKIERVLIRKVKLNGNYQPFLTY